MFRRLGVVPIVVIGMLSSARADDAPLTLQRVVEIVRTRAPATVIARARTDEARAALVGARRLSTRNPVLQADAGPRWEDGRSTDLAAELSIPLDLGGRRSKRIAVADADVRRQQLEGDAAIRQTIAIALVAYYQVLHADRRLALAQERLVLAEASETTARQRQRAGDVAEFEVNLARGEVARARGGVASATSDVARARGELAVALAIDVGTLPRVAGDLGDRQFLEQAAPAGFARPDLQVLAEEANLAKAEAALARTERWPALDLRLTFERERDADVVLGGIAIVLPIFDRGQGDEARARARARRAGVELGVRTAAVSTEVASARTSYSSAIEAVRLLADQAVPLSLDNEAAAAASFRAGKIDFSTLLVIRREALDTRREHLDRLLEAALAGIDLWIAQGRTP